VRNRHAPRIRPAHTGPTHSFVSEVLTDDEPGIFGLRPPAADSPPRNRFFGAISGAERKASCEKSTFLRSGCQMALALALYPQVLSQGFAQERRIFRKERARESELPLDSIPRNGKINATLTCHTQFLICHRADQDAIGC
jgi:hypothetical protein